MKIETLYKYLDFIKKECERHSMDDNINEDEINQLNIEIKKFESTLNQSSISDSIKNEVSKINFDLDETEHDKPKYNWLKFFGGSYGREFRKQENRKNRLEKLSEDLENLIYNLKLNF